MDLSARHKNAKHACIFWQQKKMRENHPQVYKHKYILSIMIYLCEFTDLVHTYLELGMWICTCGIVPCSLTPAPQPKEDEQRLQGT